MSGCTTTGIGAGSGSGVVIETFEPEFNNVYIKEPVTFQIKIKNAGSVESDKGVLEILGLETESGWEEHTWVGPSSFDRLLAINPEMGTATPSTRCFWRVP